jgi:Spy/CpxP family protein refolding chaperone
MDMYKVAVQNKYRFQYKGLVSVEDLYGLTVEELDKIYQGLMAQKQAANNVSLLTKRDAVIAIITDIVADKLAAADARKVAAEKKAKRQQIMGIIADKQNEALRSMSPEELEKMLSEL